MPKRNIAFALLFFATLFPVFGAAPAAKADTLAPKQEVIQTPDTTNRKHLGRLSIVSTPAKAEVSVDSIPKGECPVIVDSVAPGTHMIIVKGKGYFGKKIIVDALADTTVDVAVTLVAPADLVVLSDPVGAIALIDGKGVGATPCDLQGLKPGNHALKLDKAGFVSLEKQVVLTEAKTDTISIVLRPVGAANELPSGGNAPQQTNTGQSPTANSPPRQTESVGNMVLIQGGTFMAGFNDGSSDENPKHQVKLSEFYMDKTDVTQAEFKKVMGTNPAQFKGDLTRPVEHVTWFDAVLYCNARSKLEGKDTVYTYTAVARSGDTCTGLTGISSNTLTKGYRLPTEAEWEYACQLQPIGGGQIQPE